MAGIQFFNMEALTVGSSSVGFTAATYAGADYAHVYVDETGADVRFRLDGGAASTTNGISARIGDEIILESADEVIRFRAIRDSSSNATLVAHFGRRS